MAIKKFKPRNPEEYIELKPGILVRKDRIQTAVDLSKQRKMMTKLAEKNKEIRLERQR